MSDFSKQLFAFGISLVRAQAEQDRSDLRYGMTDYRTVVQVFPSEPQDPKVLFVCAGCGKESLNFGDFPYHSFECKQLHQTVVKGPVQ